MAKGVFDTKPGSRYDDEIAERYHFPDTKPYREVAEAIVGDWIIYREPQRNRGRRAYIAAARVTGIVPDRKAPGHAYALVEDFTEFKPLVPFSPVGRPYWEAVARAARPRMAGQAIQGKSLRLLSDGDFAGIVAEGLKATLDPRNAIRVGLTGVEEAQTPFEFDVSPEVAVRRVEAMLVNKKIREANFRRLVCEAYDDTCAVTGLRIINGGGRSEVQAAHIWSVADGGPDEVRNGLALSGTIHWLFDRHLISLTDDYRLLVSHNKVPAELRVLFEKQMDRIHLPSDHRLWPRPTYLARHRERYLAA